MTEIVSQKLPGKLRAAAGRFNFQRRVPEILQLTTTECGAACLAMILNYYGRKITISQIRDRAQAGRDGLTAAELVRTARGYGLRVRAISISEGDYRYIKLPAIVYWEFNHFMVVERWSERWVDVVDPGRGRRRLSLEEFEAGFTGVVLIMEPGAQFERSSQSARPTLGLYLRQLLRMPLVIAQVIGATLLLQLAGLGLPLLTKVVVDEVIPSRLDNLLLFIGIGMALLVLAQLVIAALRAFLLIYLKASLDTQIVLGFFEHMLALPYRFFQVRSSGDLISRLSSNSIIQETLSNELVSSLLDGGLIIVYLAILLNQSFSFGLAVLLIGLLQLLLLVLTSRPVRDLERRKLDAIGKSFGYAAEALSGIETLKSAGAEDRAFNRWSNLFFTQLNVTLRRDYLLAVIDALLNTLRLLSPLLLLWLGAGLVLSGAMTAGTMLALNALGLAVLTPLSNLVNSLQKVQLLHAHIDRVEDVLGGEPEQDPAAAQTPPRLTGRIELRNVSFRYNPRSAPVLKNINLTIEPGQKLAIVGRSGSGKSTLARLLLGLYVPDEGEILYDGLSLRGLNYQQVRSQFGVVLQDSYIFSAAIRENIAYNNPGLSLEQVMAAAKTAALDTDIELMPLGYDTPVSEGGSGLSGGQRQRLAIARALAGSPSIMLLDEATSHLDVTTEGIVDRNLNNLDCTRIVIAHRLSTVCNADLIVVVDQGTIVEQGTHRQLLESGGYYSALIHNQMNLNDIDLN